MVISVAMGLAGIAIAYVFYVLRPGLAVVVSPLIALMRDQVLALRAKGVRAAFLNSTLTSAEAAEVCEQAESGELSLLYVAPERLVMELKDKVQGLGVERLGADALKCRMKIGDWSVDACLQIFPEKRMLRRWFEITWQGAADTKIKSFWIQSGVLPIGENGGYFCPVQYPPRRVGAQELARADPERQDQ